MAQIPDYLGMMRRNQGTGFASDILSGLQAGMQIKNMRDQRAEREFQMQQQQAKNARRLEGQQRLLKLMRDGSDADKFYQLSVEFPELTEQAKMMGERMDSKAKDILFNATSGVWSAIESGNFGVARDEAIEVAKAYRESNMVDQAEDFESIANAISQGQTGRAGIMANTLMLASGGDKYKTLIDATKTRKEAYKIGEEGKVVDRETAAKESQAATAAGRLELDKNIFEENKKKTKGMTEEATKEYIGIKERARRGGDQRRRLSSVSGMMKENGKQIELGGIYETTKNNILRWITGSTGSAKKDILLQRIAGLSMAEAFEYKQAGPMSDAEMAQYLKAVPNSNSSDEVIAEWIATSLKVAEANQKIEKMRMKFLEKNKNIMSAGEDGFTMDIDGEEIKVEAGETIEDVINREVPVIDVPLGGPKSASQIVDELLP